MNISRSKHKLIKQLMLTTTKQKVDEMTPRRLLGEERLKQSMTGSYKQWKADVAINYVKISASDDKLEEQLNRGYTKKHNPVCSTCRTQKSRSGSCFC